MIVFTFNLYLGTIIFVSLDVPLRNNGIILWVITISVLIMEHVFREFSFFKDLKFGVTKSFRKLSLLGLLISSDVRLLFFKKK